METTRTVLFTKLLVTRKREMAEDEKKQSEIDRIINGGDEGLEDMYVEEDYVDALIGFSGDIMYYEAYGENQLIVKQTFPGGYVHKMQSNINKIKKEYQDKGYIILDANTK